MAIAFARAEYKSRAKGGRATRSAAYNERDVLADERTGERYDFRSHRQPGDIALGVLLPNGAPVRFAEPVALWNAAETAEKRKDAQVAREVVIALPKEGGVADWTVLATRFAEKHFVSKGVAVQVDIHAPDAETPNPHAHFLITTRRLTATGFEAKKARDLDPEVATAKGRAFVSDGERWGELWRQEQDEYFREQGLSLRVDPTQAKPERHLGPKRHRAPEDSAPKVDAARTELENAAAWRDPAAILEVMTRSSATFRLRELDRQLNSRIADAGERASVRASVLAHRDLVIYPSLAFAGVAFTIVSLAENARVPVDNPATHLELTMVHEAMVLEYSGRHLAMIDLAASVKLLLYASLLACLFTPLGLAPAEAGIAAYGLGIGTYLVKLAGAGAMLGVYEI